MSTEKFNLIFKLYPEEMKLSEKKRELWYHRSEGDNLPQRILDSYRDGKNDTYMLDKDGWIIYRKTGEKVIRNSRTANKPNMQKISGQAIWNGAVSRFSRNKMKDFLTAYFTPGIVRHWPESIFTTADKAFHFEFIFYFPLQLRNMTAQDIDNHSYPYTKAFMDTLVNLKVIGGDNPKYYRGFYCRYVDIPTEEDRRLEVKLHFCENNQRIT
jgi:hypothetical protein